MSAANISASKPLLDANGIQLVGMGVEKLGYEAFVKGQFFAGDLFVDEGKTAYKALALPSNSWRNLWGLTNGHMRAFISKALGLGFKNNLKGDGNQLGGTFCIAKGGKTLYAHYQSNTSFEPDVGKMLEAFGIAVPRDFNLYPAATESQRVIN